MLGDKCTSGTREFYMTLVCEGVSIGPLSLAAFTTAYLCHPVVGLHGVDPFAQPCCCLRRFFGCLRGESCICYIFFADLRHSLSGNIVLVVTAECRCRNTRQFTSSMHGSWTRNCDIFFCRLLSSCVRFLG